MQDARITSYNVCYTKLLRQRITAGIDDDSLIAPEWCRDRNAQVRHINAALKKVGLKY